MNVTVIKTSGGAVAGRPKWFEELVAAQPHDSVPSMLKVGCTEIRSAFSGAGLVLIFVWDSPTAGNAKDRSAFVAWWAAKVPGMAQVPAMPAGLTNQLTYTPDTYGRPCL